MSFNLEAVDDSRHIYRIHGDKGHLIGLVSLDVDGGNRRVELMMKIDQSGFESFEAAVAFVRGAEAAMRAFKVIPDVAKKEGAP